MKALAGVRLVAAVSTLALLLAGCSDQSAESPSTSSSSSNVVDIKDIILTNLSGDCADYSETYQAEVSDLKLQTEFVSVFTVSDDDSHCTVTSNDIPNYDFNDDSAQFATAVAEQNLVLTIPRNPVAAKSPTDLSLAFYNAVMLNGVVLDQVANGCYSPDDSAADSEGNIANGCGELVDWRLDPLGKVKFGTDSHNGHTQPGGLYHYHGNPLALFDPEKTSQGSPVIGFAADGFPIYGPHYLDPTSGKLLEAVSGYTLKIGSRPESATSPGGVYDGTYIQDYEFTDAGTLDACNGMTIDGQYGYYTTQNYPYVMGCFTGTPDQSFTKWSESFPWMISALATAGVSTLALVVLGFRRRRTKQIANSQPITPRKRNNRS